MAHGARWIDQQWLAQLMFYELFRAADARMRQTYLDPDHAVLVRTGVPPK